MTPLTILFMGTPDFGLPSLELLATDPRFRILGAVSQPEKTGKKGPDKIHYAIKYFCLARGIPLHEPHTLRKKFDPATLSPEPPDFVVVAAYGKILPSTFLNWPKRGCINLHGSLLPTWRGAAPVHHAVLNGDTTGGNTIMLMDQGLDTGDILATEEIPLDSAITGGELYQTLAKRGAPLLVETLIRFARGEISPRPQNHARATLAPKIEPRDGLICWGESAIKLHNRIRAMNPRPLAMASFNQQSVKLVQSLTPIPPLSASPASATPPGTVVDFTRADGALWVQTGTLPLRLTALQPANKRIMSAADFRNGYRVKIGDRFGNGITS